MDNTSPFVAMQRLERELKALLRALDTDTLSSDEKRAVAALRRLAVDVRLDIRDYELSETREEQLKCAVVGKKRLAKLQASILTVSLLFSPADVAQMGARLEQINGWLR